MAGSNIPEWRQVGVNFGDVNQAMHGASQSLSSVGDVFGKMRQSLMEQEKLDKEEAFRQAKLQEDIRQFGLNDIINRDKLRLMEEENKGMLDYRNRALQQQAEEARLGRQTQLDVAKLNRDMQQQQFDFNKSVYTDKENKEKVLARSMNEFFATSEATSQQLAKEKAMADTNLSTVAALDSTGNIVQTAPNLNPDRFNELVDRAVKANEAYTNRPNALSKTAQISEALKYVAQQNPDNPLASSALFTDLQKRAEVEQQLAQAKTSGDIARQQKLEDDVKKEYDSWYAALGSSSQEHTRNLFNEIRTKYSDRTVLSDADIQNILMQQALTNDIFGSRKGVSGGLGWLGGITSDRDIIDMIDTRVKSNLLRGVNKGGVVSLGGTQQPQQQTGGFGNIPQQTTSVQSTNVPLTSEDVKQLNATGLNNELKAREDQLMSKIASQPDNKTKYEDILKKERTKYGRNITAYQEMEATKDAKDEFEKQMKDEFKKAKEEDKEYMMLYRTRTQRLGPPIRR